MRKLMVCLLHSHFFLVLLTTSSLTLAGEILTFQYFYSGKRYETKAIELPENMKNCERHVVSMFDKSKNCNEQQQLVFDAFYTKVTDAEIAIIKNKELKKQEDEKNMVNFNNERIVHICNIKYVGHTSLVEQIASQANVHPKTVELKDYGIVEINGFKTCSGKFYHPNGISTFRIYYPKIGEDYKIYSRHLNSKSQIQYDNPPAKLYFDLKCMKLVC